MTRAFASRALNIYKAEDRLTLQRAARTTGATSTATDSAAPVDGNASVAKSVNATEDMVPDARNMIRRAFASVWRGVRTGYTDWKAASPAQKEQKETPVTTSPTSTRWYRSIVHSPLSWQKGLTTQATSGPTARQALPQRTALCPTEATKQSRYDFSALELQVHDGTVGSQMVGTVVLPTPDELLHRIKLCSAECADSAILA